jgi:hypothetical protein
LAGLIHIPVHGAFLGIGALGIGAAIILLIGAGGAEKLIPLGAMQWHAGVTVGCQSWAILHLQPKLSGRPRITARGSGAYGSPSTLIGHLGLAGFMYIPVHGAFLGMGALGIGTAIILLIGTGGAEKLIPLGAMQWHTGVTMGCQGQATGGAVDRSVFDSLLTVGTARHRGKR